MLYFLIMFDSLWHTNVSFIWKLEKLKLSLEISSNSSRYALPRNPGNRGSDTLIAGYGYATYDIGNYLTDLSESHRIYVK